ncbi:DUF3078 domain-containing protein [Chitinophagaceae bacterium LWZ2-11]
MKFIVVGTIAFFLVCKISAQDIVVNTLRTETSRSIKKDKDTIPWRIKHGGLLSFNVSQGSLSNWAAGGDNFSLTVGSYFNYFRFYKDSNKFWDNNLDVNLAYLQSTSLGSRKNDDRIDFISKYGYRLDTVGKLFISALFNFRSQFFDGYTYPGSTPVFASSVLSPAYLTLSAGIDYKPNDKFSAFLSPLTSRLTVVTNNKLSAEGAYGVDTGKHSINAIGAFATFTYNNIFNKIFNYKGRLDLFSNYQNNPQNVDIYMTNILAVKINKYFAATYSLDLIYDDDVRIFGPNGKSPGLQTKSQIGLSFMKPLNVVRIK